ncbi:MAG: hypothetical protein OXC42_02555 [Gammaproteobacteria bacterium]|nr:hypothetical protein [Gammaproteobacteria bacterium]
MLENQVKYETGTENQAMYIDYMKGRAVKIEILHFPDNPKRFFTYKQWFDHSEGLVEELAEHNKVPMV